MFSVLKLSTGFSTASTAKLTGILRCVAEQNFRVQLIVMSFMPQITLKHEAHFYVALPAINHIVIVG